MYQNLSSIGLRTKKHIALNSSLSYVNWFKRSKLSTQTRKKEDKQQDPTV